MSERPPSSTCDDTAWDECEDRVSEPFGRALNANSVDEEAAAMRELFAICEGYLSSSVWDYSTQIYRTVAEAWWHWVNGRLHGPQLPDWIKHRAGLEMPDYEQGQLYISLIEPLVEDPVRIEDLDWIFSLLDNPRTVWAVECAFENEEFSANAIQAYQEFAKRESAAGRVPPPLPERYQT